MEDIKKDCQGNQTEQVNLKSSDCPNNHQCHSCPLMKAANAIKDLNNKIK